MSRMYSRRKGKAGSKRPAKLEAPWVTYSSKEIEELVVKLAKQGLQTAQIGLALRDQYGVPTVRINNIKLSQIMVAHQVAPKFPEDMFNLMKKAVNLASHMTTNKTDYTSKRGLELTESKIRRLAKFHIRNKTLPATWKYNLEQAKLLVK